MICLNVKNTLIDIDNYIIGEYYKCLYLYLDYKKYGLNSDNVKMWCEINEDTEEPNLLVLKYYSGMHIYSRDNNYDVNQLANLVIEEKPTIICGEKNVIKRVEDSLRKYGYESEYGYVRELSNINVNDRSGVKKAITDKDFQDIAQLLFNDNDIGSSYKLEDLTSQIIQRNNEKYGRNYIIKDGNTIIAHAGTGAENDKVAMLSYVITHPNYRKKGYALKVCSAVCEDLINEGKKVYLINYTNESTRLYDKLGFKVCCEWGKLYQNLKKEG